MESSVETIKRIDLRHNKFSDYRETAKNSIKNNPYGYSYNTTSYSNSSSHTTPSSHCTNYINCTFYEWSRIDIKNRKFYTESELRKFLTECNISLDKDDEEAIKTKYMLFMTCVPGERKLLIAASYYALQNMLEKAYKDKGIDVPKSYYTNL